MEKDTLIELTSDIVSAHVAANHVEPDEVATLIQNVFTALNSLGNEAEEEAAPEPVVSQRASVKKDHLVCMACGAKQKILKRHLMTAHDMTPGEYRSTYNLPSDYPMVAPDYAEKRSQMAKDLGLGRKAQKGRGRKKGS
jgi:predicted transcriptional regulator